MKILYINSLDKRYGSTYRCRNIVKALENLGHDVTYIESNLEEKLFKRSICIKQEDSLAGYFVAICRRARMVFSETYGILYIQKFTPLTVPCLVAGRLRRKECIVDWDDLDWTLQGSILKKILVFICEFAFPFFANKITTHSFLLRELAQRRGVKNVFIVNQVVDFNNRSISEEERASIKKKYNLGGKKVLAYLCTLTAGGARDIDVVIKWASTIIKKDNEVFLFIVGGGPLENAIKNLLSDHGLQFTADCVITGLIDHQDVLKYLSVSDAGLIYMRDNLANRYRMSFKALEYLFAGIPVVGHVVGETRNRLCKYINQADLAKVTDDFSSESILRESNHKKANLDRNEYSINSLKKDLGLVFQSE